VAGAPCWIVSSWCVGLLCQVMGDTIFVTWAGAAILASDEFIIKRVLLFWQSLYKFDFNLGKLRDLIKLI
jgi:hypothetical protein